MPKIEILVNKFDSFDLEPPPPPEVGKRGFFSNDLRLDRYDNRTPGNGPNDPPQNATQRRAGTHSGSVTLLRIAGVNDRFYPAAAFSSNTKARTGSMLCRTLLCRRVR